MDFRTDHSSRDYVGLTAKISRRMLKEIMERNKHWNNAEIGGHIRFHRTPNIYQPDVHLLMSYFHI